MREGKSSQDNHVWANTHVLTRVCHHEVLQVAGIVARGKSIPPSSCEPAAQRIQHASRKGDNLIRQASTVEEPLNDRCMRAVGGDVERNEVGKVGCVYYR